MATTTADLDVSGLLTVEQSAFAVHVATGYTFAESSRRAGVSVETGYKFKELPSVQERIRLLIAQNSREDLGSIASRAWIETQLVAMCNDIDARDDDKNYVPLARLKLEVLMSLAKLKGMVIERKQSAVARVDLTKPLEGPAVESHMAELLDACEPGARREIRARLEALAVKKRTLAPARIVSQTPPPVVVDAITGAEQ